MSNEVIILFTSLFSLAIAQLSKFVIESIKKHRLDFRSLYTTGGMPSSHSAFVITLTVALLLFEGINYFFVISLIFSIIVVHDSMGVRYEASKHAKMLNNMAREKTEEEQKEIGYDREFKELLGHRPIEAYAGVLLGIFVALISFLIFA